MATKNAGAEMMLKNVRLSFPSLWSPQTGPNPNDAGKPAYTAQFLIEDSAEVANVRRVIGLIAKEAWGDNAQTMLKTLAEQNRIALKNGDSKTDSNGNVLDGYAGNWFLSARSYTRPTVVDRDRSPLTEGDGKPYSGCYVNAKVRLWVQSGGQYGRRINCQLMGVQFAKDGESFGGGRVASPDEFDTLDEFANEGEAAGSDDAGGLW